MKRAVGFRFLNVLTVLAIPIILSGCLGNDPQVDQQAQFEADVATIDSYIASKGQTALKDPIGIRVSIDNLGTGGFPAKPDQTVKVKYTGGILNGSSPFATNETANDIVKNFISGWQYALAIMPKGSKFTLYVPSLLGYGNLAVGPIPSNSILVFQMEILDVISSTAEKQRLVSDVAAIDQWLTDHNVANVVKDSTGIRYVIKEPGAGETPTWYNSVRFTYTGKVLSTDKVFFTGTAEPTENFASRVVDFIHGLKAGLQHLRPGSKATIYIPSGLAFGADESSGTVPANSNVVYEIEFKEIIP